MAKKTDPQKQTALQKNLAYLMERDGVSMAATSQKAGLGETKVHHIMSSAEPNPRLKTTLALANLFRVPHGQLIDGDLAADDGGAIPAPSTGLITDVMKDAITDVVRAALDNDYPIAQSPQGENTVTPEDIATAALFIYREELTKQNNDPDRENRRERMINNAKNVIRFTASRA